MRLSAEKLKLKKESNGMGEKGNSRTERFNIKMKNSLNGTS